MNAKKITPAILLMGLFALSACEFPGYRIERERVVPTDTPTSSPTAEVVAPTETPSPATQIEPTTSTPEPTPEASESIPIGIDNVEQIALQTRIETGLDFLITALDLSPDGRILAFVQWGDRELDVRLVDMQEERLLQPLDFHATFLADVAFSADGEWLASCSQDGVVALWEVENWELVGSFSTYARGASSLAFSPDGSLLAVGGYRNQLGVWRLSDLERVNYFEWSGPHMVDKIAFTADGSRYFADTGYADVTVWNTADGELLQSFRGEACIGGFDLSSDETRLAYSSSCSDAHEPHDPLARVAVRDVATGEALVYGDRKEVSTILYYTADDRLIVTNSRQTLRFWDAGDGSLVHQIAPLQYYAEYLLSEDGSWLVLGSGSGDILIYAVE